MIAIGKKILIIKRGSIPNTAWANGNCRQAAGWGKVDGKLLKGNIRDKGNSG